MNRKRSSWLAVPLLLLGQLAGGAFTAHGDDFTLQNTAATGTDSVAAGTDSKGSSDIGEGVFSRKRLTLTFDSRIGYDDNTLAQSNAAFTTLNNAGVATRNRVDGQGSVFLNFDLGATYLLVTSRTSLSIGADVGISYFFDRPGRDYDINGGLSLGFSYKLAPRLFLQASSYNAYVSQGDYGASNLTNFTGSAIGGVRTPGTTDNRNGDYFYTSNTLSLAYQLAPRISLSSGYGITAFAYNGDPYATIDDRVEQFFSEEFRFLLLPNLTLAADYRFGLVTYLSVNNDSYTHFVLGGVDYVFSPRLRGSVRAGVEFRVYPDAVGDETSPYAEASLNYDIGRRTSIAFTGRYGIEEGGLTADVSNSNTVRLGLSLNEQFTPRISGYLSFYYTHSYYQNQGNNVPNFNENTYDVALGGRYAITRNLSLEAGYTYTKVDSDQAFRGYDRNRVFGGVRVTF